MIRAFRLDAARLASPFPMQVPAHRNTWMRVPWVLLRLGPCVGCLLVGRSGLAAGPGEALNAICERIDRDRPRPRSRAPGEGLQLPLPAHQQVADVSLGVERGAYDTGEG